MEASALPAPSGLRRISVTAPLLKLRTDDQLVALFRAGNDEAFRAIHDRYRARLFAYVRQMLMTRQDAEDALQEVFIRAYGGLRSHGRPVTLRAWLYRIAHNRCVDHLRRQVPAPAQLADVLRPPAEDPLAAAQRREDLRRLVEDVRRLPEQQRSALLMREMEGFSYMDLSEALGVSIPATKSLLVRARVGLAAAGEARDTACEDIQGEIAIARARGVRSSGRVRRHLADCTGCRDYRTALRRRERAFGALTPGGGWGPLGLLAKLVGLGGGGAAWGGATAGGGAVATGGAAAGGAAISASQVAAAVATVVVTAGGAVGVQSRLADRSEPSQPPPAAAAPVVRHAVSPPAAAPALAPDRAIEPLRAPAADPAAKERAKPQADERAAERLGSDGSGGALAPADSGAVAPDADLGPVTAPGDLPAGESPAAEGPESPGTTPGATAPADSAPGAGSAPAGGGDGASGPAAGSGSAGTLSGTANPPAAGVVSSAGTGGSSAAAGG